MEEISIEQQRLLYWGKELKNNQKLSAYDIEDGAIILLSLRSGAPPSETKTEPVIKEIFIQTINKKFALAIDINCTVYDLKRLIQQKQSIKIAHQRLCYSTKQLTNDMPLSYYNITHGSIIQLVLRLWGVGGGGPMQIVIQTVNGKSVTMDYKPYEKISTIKTHIPSAFLGIEGIEILIFDKLVLFCF
eukprot:1012889_1